MTTTIIGVGMIGGSFALALRRHALAARIWGVEASAANAEEALRLGLVDEIVTPDRCMAESDLIVIAIPVDEIPLLAVKLLNRVSPHQTIIDMGSVKGELCEAISMHPNRCRFVATHPMWGTEYSGPAAARNDAFARRTVVILEKERSAPDAVSLVEHIYATIGMNRTEMASGEEHDLHTAYVSHISHITSFALALTVLEKEREDKHIFNLAGGGFESTVRLAKSSAATWVPILLKNKYNVLDVLREHIHQLQIMRKMIENDDAEGLGNAIRHANRIQRIIE